MSKVWTLELDHGRQAVMLVLADHAHDDGTRSYPGVDYIAWKTNYSRRQVQRYLDALCESGLIQVSAYATGGRGHATEYSLHLEKGDTKSPFMPRQRVTNQTVKGDISGTKGDKFDVKGDIAVSPQPLTIKEPSGEPSVKESDVVDESYLDSIQARLENKSINIEHVWNKLKASCGGRGKLPNRNRFTNFLSTERGLYVSLPDFINQDVWERWDLYRAEIGKPLNTQSIIDAQLRTMQKMHDAGQDIEAVIDQSIGSRYQGLFTVKDNRNGSNQISSGPQVGGSNNGRAKPSIVERIAAYDYSIFDDPAEAARRAR